MHGIVNFINKNHIPEINALLSETETLLSNYHDSMAAQVEGYRADSDTTIANTIVQFEAIVMAINNRVGPENIVRTTLTTPSTMISVNPAWPNAHPIMHQITQDATGGRTITFGPGITGPLVKLNPAPGAVTEFIIIPNGAGAWRAVQWSSPLVGGVTDATVSALLGNADSDLWDAFLARLVGALETDNPAINALDSTIGGLVEIESETSTALTQHTNTLIGAALVVDKFDPLTVWTNAVQSQGTACAVGLSLGDSIAVGGNYTTESRAWFGRVSALYGPRPIIRLDDVSLIPAPANGVQMYSAALGGKASWNYLSDLLVTRIQAIQPHFITHIVGTNDYAQGIAPAVYRANIKTRVDQIVAVAPNTVHVFIHAAQRIDGLSNGLHWADYGAQLKSLAAEYGDKGVFLDVDAEFRKYGAAGITDRNNFWHADNLHFNDNGNKALAEIVLDRLGAPSGNYVQREIVRSTILPPATATTNVTVSSLTIDAKPYLREGMVSVNYYCGATSGTGDLTLKYTMVGGAEAGAKVIRLNTTQMSHSIDLYVSLEPHKDYTVQLITDVYGSGTITFGGSGPYYSFVADVSPS